MKYNHDKLDKISKELFDSLKDNSIKLDSSHFNVFNIKPLARLTAIAIVVYSFILIVVFTTWTSAQLSNFSF